jgi:poly(hydroxyalkanoate) depolymerase family esterase
MKRRLALSIKLSLTLAAWLLISTGAAHAGSWVQGSVTNAAGTRNFKLWVPDGYNKKAATPLVLMLHGCLQTPDDFAAGTRMNAVADAHVFLVAYPEQPASANPYKCWNWFDPAHQTRVAGEPSLLAAVVGSVRATHNVDPKRIYAVGVSAGGAMVSIMGAAYPDIFSGLGVCAGIEYKGATNVVGALAAQKSGGADPNAQGTEAYQAMLEAAKATHGKTSRRSAPNAVRPRPVRVIVFHGTLDTVVSPVNGEQVVAQWAQANDWLDDARDNNSVDATPDANTNGTVPNGYNFTRYVYTDAAGKPLLEKWLVEEMKHAWPGGSTDGSYTDPKAPNASEEIWRFFQQAHGRTQGSTQRRRR